MFDIASLPLEAPLPIMALYVVGNLVRGFITDYHARKERVEAQKVSENVRVLKSKLDAAEAEVERLKSK